MAYTNKQITDVKEVIEKYTDEYLERYMQASVLKQAEDAMNENKTAIQVGDTVFDYLHENCEANITIATALQQCVPKEIMLVMRQDIINTLK